MQFEVGQRIRIQLWRDTKNGIIEAAVQFKNGHVIGLTDEEAWKLRCNGEFTLDDGTLYTGELYRYISDDRHTWGWLQPNEVQPLLM